LERCLADETFFVGEEISLKVLGSSTDVVFCMKQEMQRALRLCSSQTVVEIFKVLVETMRRYVDSLVVKCNSMYVVLYC